MIAIELELTFCLMTVACFDYRMEPVQIATGELILYDYFYLKR